jgi:hypothetical protein
MTHHEVELIEKVQVIDQVQNEVEVVEGKTDQFNTNSFNPHKTRAIYGWIIFFYIAFISIGLLVGVLFFELSITDAKELSSFLLSPMFVIFGTVVGFYFAGKSD